MPGGVATRSLLEARIHHRLLLKLAAGPPARSQKIRKRRRASSSSQSSFSEQEFRRRRKRFSHHHSSVRPEDPSVVSLLTALKESVDALCQSFTTDPIAPFLIWELEIEVHPSELFVIRIVSFLQT